MLLAGDLQNPFDRLDVNGDGAIAAIDALVVRNQLPEVLGSGEAGADYSGYPDINGDNAVDVDDYDTLVDYIETMPSSYTGGSSSADSNSGDESGGSANSNTGSNAGSTGGITVSAQATATVNEAEQFTLTFSWTDAYWIVIESPYLSIGSVAEHGPSGAVALLDTNSEKYVFQSYVSNTDGGQATLTAAFPDDGPPGNGQSSDTMPIKISVFGYYDTVATQTTNVTVNNLDPVLDATMLTPNLLDEGDEAQIKILWSDAYWYEGPNDILNLQVDWDDGNGSRPVTDGSFAGCDSGDPFVACTIAKHIYLDDDPTTTPSDDYTITVKLEDDDTGVVTKDFSLTVKNVDPKVTITSITPIDSVSTDDGGVNGRLDDTEGFVVKGTVTDPGILDTHTATIKVDRNFDGDFDDDGEAVNVPLAGGNGSWTFEYTVPSIFDDGAFADSTGAPAWNNETTNDTLPVSAFVVDDDTGTAVQTSMHEVYNVPPQFESNSHGLVEPAFTFEFDDEGVYLKNAIVAGSFKDVGTKDFHEVKITWGDGVVTPEVLGPGVTTYAITRNFGIPGRDDFESIFPIEVEVFDDDKGTISTTKHFSCSDVTPPGSQINGIQYIGGRGLFEDVELLWHDPNAAANSDGVIGSEFGMLWDANKPAFIGKGVCEVGILQIARTETHYWGFSGELQELFNNEEWHVDKGVPYPNEWFGGRGTSDNPFSTGKLSAQDSPGSLQDIIGIFGPSWLQNATQEFETCVVALQGAEGIHMGTLLKGPTMAVYGCISWGYDAALQDDGSYRITRWLAGSTAADDSVDLEYAGPGQGPSDKFKEVVELQFDYPIIFTP